MSKRLKYFDIYEAIKGLDDEEMLRHIKSSNIILFNETINNEYIYTYFKTGNTLIEMHEKSDEILAAIPFDYTWYESTREHLYIGNIPGYKDWDFYVNGILMTDENSEKHAASIVGFKSAKYPNRVSEVIVSPFSLESMTAIFEHFEESIKKNNITGDIEETEYNVPRVLTNMCVTVACILNESIVNGRSFTESTRIREKIKTKGKKEFITVRKLVYIGGKKQETYDTPSGKTIEYSHRFEIRGHWRTLNYGKIGKDRNGNYVVPEKTWVRPFEKGNKELPLIKKTRIVNKVEVETA